MPGCLSTWYAPVLDLRPTTQRRQRLSRVALGGSKPRPSATKKRRRR